MASAEDIYNALQATNSKLDQLHTDILAGTNATHAVRAEEEETRQHLDAGFAALVSGNAALADLHDQTNRLLAHLAVQNETQLCLLDAIARQTCALLNHAASQTAAQHAIMADTAAGVFLYSTSNPASALELARAAEAKARVDACCPPEPPEPECRFEGCPPPPRRAPRPSGATMPAYPFPPDRPDDQQQEKEQPR